MKTALITKVYDTYENRDYDGIGCDNLNPVREITRETPEDELITQVKTRIGKIKESLSLHPDFKHFIVSDETIPINSNDSSAPSSMTPQEVLSRAKMGTPGSAPLWGDSINSGDSSLEEEINMMIAQVVAYTQADVSSTYSIDCNGIATEINPENDVAGKAEKEAEEAARKREEASSDPSSEEFNPETATEVAAAKQQALDDAANAREDAAILQCALKELSFLKIILIIVKVIRVLKTLCGYILNITYVVIDVVQLAAGAWLNYSNIGKIANKIITRVMAIVVQLISKIIQKLWNLLHFECVTSMTSSLIDQIKEAMAGISSIKTLCNPSALNFGFSEVVKSLQESWQEMIENSAKGINMDELRNAGKSIVQTLKSSAEGAVEAARDQAFGNVAGTVSAAKSAYETAAKLFGKSNPAASDIANASAVLGANLT